MTAHRRGGLLVLFLLLVTATGVAIVRLATGPDDASSAAAPGTEGGVASPRPPPAVTGTVDAPPLEEAPDGPTAAAEPAREEEEKEEIVVRGRVVSAADGSPVKGGEVVVLGEPPAFVPVPLRADTGWKGPARDAEPLASASVDGDGRFELRAPIRHGFVATAQPWRLGRAIVPLPRDGREVVLRVDVAGRVTGRVERPDGTPIAGVSVRLGEPIDPMKLAREGRKMRDAIADSDADGRFRFAAAPVGELVVKVRADDRPEALAHVRVSGGETASVTVVLEEGYALHGLVTTERGIPVAGARVRVSASAIDLSSAQRGEFVDDARDTTSDDAGRFTVRGLSEGEFDVVARESRHAAGKVRHVAVPRAAAAGAVVVVLPPGRTIAGRVVGPDGEAIPRAVVGCTPKRGMFGMDLTATVRPKDAEDLGGVWTVAGEDGRFESPPLPDGSFMVVAEADGFSRGALSDVAAGTAGHTLELRPSGAIHGIVLSRVDGDPVRSFWITAMRPFELMNAASYVPAPVQLVEEDDGTFVIDDVEAGEWTIEVAADGYGRIARPVTVEEGEATRGVILLLPEEGLVKGVVVSSATGEPIAGATLSTKSGMEALRPDPIGTPGATTDEVGEFEIGGLAGGRLQLAVRAPDHAPGSSERLTVVEGGVVEGVVVRLDAGAVIRGRVTGPGGVPVGGALVQAIMMGTVTPAMAHTDADGRYELRGLSPGSYTVNKLGGKIEVGADDMLSTLVSGLATKTIRLVSGEEAVLDFAAGGGGTVRFTGRVTEGGDPMPNAILSLTPEEIGDRTGELRIGSTDREGEFVLEGMHPGEWTLTVQVGSPFGQSTKQSFDVAIPDAPAHREEFELAVTGFEGRVTTDALNLPIEGVRVAVDALDEGVKIDAVSRAAGSRRVADVFTDVEGRYRVSGLRPGRYRAVAGGPGMFGFGGSGHRRSEPTEVEVRDGELRARVDFRLRPGGMLAGRVADRDRNAVAAATVFLVPAGGPSERHFGEILSDETGAYHANGLDPDRYVLVVKAPGFAPAIESGVRIREGEETVRDVTLRDGADLTLELRDSGGAAVVGASVRLFGPDGTELTRFVTIGDALSEVVQGGTPGTVALGALEPGSYTARIERGGAAETVTIQHGGADQVVPVTLP